MHILYHCWDRLLSWSDLEAILAHVWSNILVVNRISKLGAYYFYWNQNTILLQWEATRWHRAATASRLRDGVVLRTSEINWIERAVANM